MTQRYFIDPNGKFIGSYDGPEEDMPEMFIGAGEVASGPNDGRQVWENGAWLPLPPEFLPIEPVPFWRAAFTILELKKSDVLNALTDPNERYLAELEIEGRKTYRRDDPLVVKLAQMKGYTPERMDALWLEVQQTYK